MNIGELMRILNEINQTEKMIHRLSHTGNPQLDIVASLDPKVVRLKSYAEKLRAIPLNYEVTSNGNRKETPAVQAQEGPGPQAG